MNINSPAEIVAAYSKSGRTKANREAAKLFVLGIMAGMTIAFGSAVSNMTSHAVDSVSLAKLISGLIFPFGLCIIMLMGMELFTGNVMISISVMNKEATIRKMLRNWLLVYSGNFVGSAFVACGTALFGQLDYSSGGLAAYTMKVAVTKIDQPFQNLVFSGLLCNLLVCMGVLCFYAAKETAAKFIGCFMPVAFFVILGFEHSVANMYYLTAALLAKSNPVYLQKAIEAGYHMDKLTVSNALFSNLIPVTIGNILGGLMVSVGMWSVHGKNQEEIVHVVKVSLPVEIETKGK